MNLLVIALTALTSATFGVQADDSVKSDRLPIELQLSDYDRLFTQMGAPDVTGKSLPLSVTLAPDYMPGMTKRAALLSFSDKQTTNQVSIGTGGDIYSWKLDGQELMSPQDHWWSQWVDEVFQVVLTRIGEGAKRKVGGWRYDNPFFIHQAGSYADRRFRDRKNYYSPVLAVEFEQKTNALYILSWPQQAHVPENLRSDFLMLSRITHPSDSFLAIDVLAFNKGSEKLNYINFPWGGVRRSAFNEVNSWQPDHVRNLPYENFKDQHKLAAEENTGVFLWTRNGGGNAAGAMVYATDIMRNGARTRAILRYGYAGGIHGPEQRNLFLATAVGKADFFPGDALLTRYYLGFGERQSIERQLRDNHFKGVMAIASAVPPAAEPSQKRVLSDCYRTDPAKALVAPLASEAQKIDIALDWIAAGSEHPVYLFDDDPKRPGAFASSDIYFGATAGNFRTSAADSFLQREPVRRLLGFSPTPVPAAFCPKYAE